MLVDTPTAKSTEVGAAVDEVAEVYEVDEVGEVAEVGAAELLCITSDARQPWQPPRSRTCQSLPLWTPLRAPAVEPQWSPPAPTTLPSAMRYCA